ARGDLDALCSQDLAVRSHGGAVRKLESDREANASRESQPHAEIGRLAKAIPTALSRTTEGNHKVARSLQNPALAGARDSGVNLTAAPKTRTITFILGNRDTVNEFQSKILLGAEGYCTGQDWALHFVSFRSDLNAPLSSVSLPEILTSSNRPSG